MMQELPLIRDPPGPGGLGSSRRPMAQATTPDYCRWLAAGFPDSRAAHSPLKPPREGRGGWEGQRARRASEANKGALEPTLAPPPEGVMVWGPPAQQSRLPEAYPRREVLFWGEGWGWPDNELQRSPTRPRPWRASGVGVRASAPSTHPPARAFRVWRSPAMIARAGEGWAPPGGSRVRVRLGRPMGSCSRVRVRSLCPAATARP